MTGEPQQPADTGAPISRDTRLRALEQALARVAGGGGDGESDHLFSEYAALRQPTLVTLAERITRCRHSAEDVVQEAFMALHRHLLDEQVNDGIGPWLTRVVANIAIDHARKARTRRAVPLDTQALPSRGDNDSLEMAGRIWERAADLPDLYRRVLELRALEGLPYAGIGKILGISSGKARLCHYRAILRLREALRADT